MGGRGRPGSPGLRQEAPSRALGPRLRAAPAQVTGASAEQLRSIQLPPAPGLFG